MSFFLEKKKFKKSKSPKISTTTVKWHSSCH